MIRGWWSPWMIVAAAAVLRALILTRTYEPVDVWRGDPRTYAEILEALLAGRIDPAMWIWPPGFPLAAVPFRLGLDPGASLHAAAWLGGVATIALLVTAARHHPSRLPLLAAAFVVAFFPEAVLAAARPLPATVAILGSVGAAVGLEAASRGGRRRWSLLAGFAGAIAILSRPETALSVPLYAVICGVRRRSALKPVLLYGIVVLSIITPYSLAFRAASGAWGLSIKPHLNVLKLRTYERGADFGERRALWDAFLDRYSDDDGNLDPRRIVEAADTRGYFLSADVVRTTASNFAYAFRRDPPWLNVLWVLGIAGLVVGRGHLRERLLAGAIAAPVISVATLFPPVERYALIAIPSLGFGVGHALGRLRSWVPRPAFPWRAIPLAGLAVLGAAEAIRSSADYHWRGRYGEFLVEHRKGNDAEAEAILREAIRVDPANPEPYERLGTLQQENGDLEGAIDTYRRLTEVGGSPVSLAALYLRTGRTEAAATLLEPLHRSPPATSEYWSVRGHLAMRERRWAEAADFFARSEALGGPAELLGINRGVALLRAGRVREGLTLLQRAAQSTNPAVRASAREELSRIRATPRAVEPAEPDAE